MYYDDWLGELRLVLMLTPLCWFVNFSHDAWDDESHKMNVTYNPHNLHSLLLWVLFLVSFFFSVSVSEIAFKWSVNFWLQLLSIRWDGKYFNGGNFYLDILHIQESWAGRNFITNLRAYSLLVSKEKCRLKSTTTNGCRHFGQSKQRKSSVLFPIQSEKSPDSGFFACDL